MLRRGGAGVQAKVQHFEFFLHFLARGGGGVLDISLGGEVRPGPLYPDPV